MSSESRRRGQEGLTLVGILIMVAISTILLGKAAESWESQVWRDREAELIFRGEQYKQAIEAFYTSQRRLPTKLEELLEVEPRSIRRLFKDPMNLEGEWVLLHADATGKRIPRNPAEGEEMEGPGSITQRGRSGPTQSRVRYGMPGKRSRQQLGSGAGARIIGVASSATRDTVRIYNGATTATEWEFVAAITPPQTKSRNKRRRDRRNPPGKSNNTRSSRTKGPGNKRGVSPRNP